MTFKMFFFSFETFDVNNLCEKTAIILTVVKWNYGVKLLVMNNIKKFYIIFSGIKYIRITRFSLFTGLHVNENNCLKIIIICVYFFIIIILLLIIE